jgi:two-component system, chemotaxis family, sensor kinase CheA
LHLLRNAVDHGLETAKERVAAGKAPTGTVRIVAESRESQILLQIRDDGRGVDIESVRQTAIERGLIERDRAMGLTHREILNFIFMPGFSTRREVTETSGRGVGLDVVRENVARLGGRIDFYSDKGQRTEFLVSLPLTLAAARGLFVSVGRNIYCLPLTNVDEALSVDPKELGTAQGKLFLQHRHQAIPYVRLDDVLSGRPTQRPDRRSYAVILALSNTRLAVGVDELLGQEEVVVKALAPGTPKLALVAGGTTLADGRLVTVLEPGPLVDAASGVGVRLGESTQKEHVSTVLVCDDALTTRTMIASVLERAGYRTLTAPDGETGFGIAMRELPSLIVSDVEMPVLDGLGLCERVRATPQLANTPLILVTSLGEKQELARGAQAGATAYIVKKDFDPAGFLELVSDLVGELRRKP